MSAPSIVRPLAVTGLLTVWALLSSLPASAWDIPPDNGTLPAAAVREILAADEYPVTTGYTQRIEFIDFVRQRAAVYAGRGHADAGYAASAQWKKLVVVGGEPGSEYGMDFVSTVEEGEGPGGLAREARSHLRRARRVSGAGISSRRREMDPGQRFRSDAACPSSVAVRRAHWTESDYEVRRSGVSAVTSASASAVYRFPKRGTELEKQMLAATPRVFVEGYRLALEKAIPDRTQAFVLFWGMSTGGASLYPLAKYYLPDGYLGWGTSSTGLAQPQQPRRSAATSTTSTTAWPLRVRERGLDDFEFYTRTIDPATRERWWQAALRSPRFKSTEDAAMYFAGGALTEHGMRLWQSDLLPAADRAARIRCVHAGDVRAELSACRAEESRGPRSQRHRGRNAAPGDR